MEERKIIQIMPVARGSLWAVYKEETSLTACAILTVALYDNGDVEALDLDMDDGSFVELGSCANFMRCIYALDGTWLPTSWGGYTNPNPKALD